MAGNRIELSSEEVRAEYESGMSMNAIARKHGCSVAAVKRRLDDFGIKATRTEGAKRGNKGRREHLWNDVARLLGAGVTECFEIAKQLSVSESLVKALCCEHGRGGELVSTASRRKQLDAEREAVLREGRACGKSVSGMAAELGLSMTQTGRLLQKYGLSNPIGRSDINDIDLVEGYKAGLTINELADRYQCSHDTVTKRLAKHGIKCGRTEGILRHFERAHGVLWPDIHAELDKGRSVWSVSQEFHMRPDNVERLVMVNGYKFKDELTKDELLARVDAVKARLGERSHSAIRICDAVRSYVLEHASLPTIQEIRSVVGLGYTGVVNVMKRNHLESILMYQWQGKSQSEIQVAQWLCELGLASEQNNRDVISFDGNSLELDFYIADLELGIEVNPSWTHSVDNVAVRSVSRCYHQKKALAAIAAGIGLLHLYDRDLHDGMMMDKLGSLVLSRTARKQVVGARECEVVEIGRKEADCFLRKWHLQGDVPGQHVDVGLVCNGELISLICVGKPRYGDYSWELLRYCPSPEWSVAGGFDRLLSFFEERYASDGQTLVSYMDLNKRFRSDDVYETHGFEFDGVTSPGYSWYRLDGSAWMSRYQTQKLMRSEDKLSGVSERELMLSKGYIRVFDAGSKRYVRRIRKR